MKNRVSHDAAQVKKGNLIRLMLGLCLLILIIFKVIKGHISVAMF